MIKSKIITQHDPPPIPNRNYDWMAWREGNEENGPIGYGKTEKIAIQELKELEE